MKYSSRFFLYAPLGVFLILFAIAAIHWWMAASALSGKLAVMNGREVVPGVTLTYGKRTVTGFPFNLDVQLENVTLSLKTVQGTTRWTAEKFASHALTYGRDETIFEAAGHQTLQWTGADGTLRSLPFAVGALRASAIVKNGALNRFDLDLIGFGSKAFTAQRLQFHARQNGDIQLLVSVEGLRTPAGTCALASLDKANLSATTTHSDAFAPLLMGARDFTLAVVDWRNAGGKLGRYSLDVQPNTASARIDAGLVNLSADEIPGIRSLSNAFCG